MIHGLVEAQTPHARNEILRGRKRTIDRCGLLGERSEREEGDEAGTHRHEGGRIGESMGSGKRTGALDIMPTFPPYLIEGDGEDVSPLGFERGGFFVPRVELAISGRNVADSRADRRDST